MELVQIAKIDQKEKALQVKIHKPESSVAQARYKEYSLLSFI